MSGDATKAVASETDALCDELTAAYEELDLRQRLLGVFEDDLDYRVVLGRLVECVRHVLPIEQALAIVIDRDSEKLRIVFRHGGAMATPLQLPGFEERLREEEILRGGVRVFRKPADLRAETDMWVLRMVRSLGPPVVLCPLQVKSRLVGLLFLRVSATARELAASQLRLLQAVAQQASLAIHLNSLLDQARLNEGLRREVEIARGIQLDLLPKQLPASERYDLFAGCTMAARIGGDYYDLFRSSDGDPAEPASLGVLVADVSGHSVASALVAAIFRSHFRHLLGMTRAPDRLFAKVNDAMCSEIPASGGFLSAFYGLLDERTLTFRYTNAGHPRPFLVEAGTTSVRDLSEAEVLIGVVEGVRYPLAETSLRPDDILVVYTDGLVEAEDKDGERFGIERLREEVRRRAALGAREIHYGVLDALYRFEDPKFHQDDVTLIILKVRG